jgi:hypothetical protein
MRLKQLVLEALPAPIAAWLRKVWRAFLLARIDKPYREAGLSITSSCGMQITIKSHAEWFMFNRSFVLRACDRAIEPSLSLVRPGVQFNYLDLGANVGYFAVRVADAIFEQYDRAVQILMILVEGSPTVCAELRSRMAEIPTNICCKVVPGLVGAREGETYIYESAHHVSNSLEPTEGSTRRRLARFVDVGALAADLEVIHFLKCTIEGQQQAFLENYPDVLDKVATGFIEIKRQNNMAFCVQLLEARGFLVECLRPLEDGESVDFIFHHPERCRLLADHHTP